MDIKRKPIIEKDIQSSDQIKKNVPPTDFNFTKIKKNNSYKIISLILGIIFFISIFYLTFLIFKVNRLGEKINPQSKKEISLTQTIKNFATDDFPTLKGEEDDRINILLLGIAGEKKPGQNLTDTIIVASVDTKLNKVGLLSIPRDLYVKIPELRIQSKINSVYQAGLSYNQKDSQKAARVITETVEKITNLNIHYYLILNFDGFEKIVDSLGGINVINERDIYDSRYPGPNYSYETFQLEKGFHHLDGSTALKYSRERHSDPQGDFGRAKRQQQVLQAIKNKFFSAKTFLNIFALNDLFDALGNNIKTNIEINEFGSLVSLAQKLDTQNINNVVIDAWNKESLLKVAHIFYGNTRAFVLIPRVGNWTEIQEVAKNIFTLNEIEKRKAAIQKEDTHITILNASGNLVIGEKIKKALAEHLSYKNITLNYSLEKNIVEKTFVYDLSSKDKLYTLDEIIKVLPANLSSNNDYLQSHLTKTKKEPDIIIVIGKDLIDIYNVEEGTLEDLEKEQDDLFKLLD